MVVQNRESRYRISRCISSLLSTHPFFAHLALHLKIHEDFGVDTIACDGKDVWYNPTWVEKTPGDQIKCAVARLVLACALKHHTRRGDRDYNTWQKASQMATLPILYKAGLTPERFAQEVSAEEAYDMLPKEHGDSGGGEGEGQGQQQGGMPGDGEGSDQQGSGPDPDGKGEIRDAPQSEGESPAEQAASKNEEEQKWDSMLHRANQGAKAAGKGTSAIEDLVSDMHNSKLDWRTIMRRWMTDSVKTDHSWSHPNRRFIADGLYLPSLQSDAMPPFVFAIDTSGSMAIPELSACWSELRMAVQELNPESFTIVQCDTKVHKVERLNPHQLPQELDIVGGGGTAYRPVFEEVEKMSRPACMVFFTDLYCYGYPEVPPDYPVLWATYGNPDEHWTPPFGERIDIPAQD